MCTARRAREVTSAANSRRLRGNNCRRGEAVSRVRRRSSRSQVAHHDEVYHDKPVTDREIAPAPANREAGCARMQKPTAALFRLTFSVTEPHPAVCAHATTCSISGAAYALALVPAAGRTACRASSRRASNLYQAANPTVPVARFASARPASARRRNQVQQRLPRVPEREHVVDLLAAQDARVMATPDFVREKLDLRDVAGACRCDGDDGNSIQLRLWRGSTPATVARDWPDG